ncbi:MAG: glycosyl transferase [Acetobacteraceae bacterium]
MQPDTIIVTGGNAPYFPLIDELRQSIAAAAPDGMPGFGVIDAGLTDDQRQTLAAAGARVVTVPDDPAYPHATLRKDPRLAVNLSKPWLDRMFPDAATIVFLDGDTWVQDWNALRMLEGAAQQHALAVVADNGRFWERQIDVRWLLGGIGGLCQVRSFFFKNGRHGGLPLSLLKEMGTRAQLNAGVFALPTDAPHWAAMRRWQAHILAAGGKGFSSDQLAMGAAIYGDHLRVELLPEGCNYIRPYRVDLARREIVEFYFPFPRVGIVHLAGQKEVRFDPNATAPLPDLDDRIHHLSLRFGHFQRMAQQVAARPSG